jgi:hypothetical protein
LAELGNRLSLIRSSTSGALAVVSTADNGWPSALSGAPSW